MRMRYQQLTVLVVMAVALGGCQYLGVQSPERPVDRYTLAVDTYAVAMETAIMLYDAEQIDADDLRDIYAVSRVARTALDSWAIALEEDRSPEAARQRFNEAIDQMQSRLDAAVEVSDAPE